MKVPPSLTRSGFAIAFGATLLTACSDQAAERAPLAPAGPSTTMSAVTEEAALLELTRLTALALQDQGLRQRVRNDLRESRHTQEHKLHFTNYLNGQSGGILLAKMAKEGGKSREDVLALISAVRPLEFYMPVPQHRATWSGGAELLVASQLEDENVTPRGFDLSGRAVQFSAEQAPATPVLSLVPVETDFSRTVGFDLTNVNANGGQTIGTLAYVAIDECPIMMSVGTGDEAVAGGEEYSNIQCGGGGGYEGGGGTYTPPSKPGGLYMTSNHVNDDGEAWTKGAPEIEVHVHGPNGGDKTYGADLACAGESSTDPYRNFNQDNSSWSGEVLLFNQAQITDYNTKYPGQGFNVMMWEDDDTRCTIKTDKNMTLVLAGIAGVIGAAAVVIEKPGSTASWVKAGGMFIAALYASASWLLSNDDFLGAAPQVGTNVVRTTLYKSSSSTNGYIDTQLKYMQ